MSGVAIKNRHTIPSACRKRRLNHVLRRALELEVDGLRRRGRPKKTWKKQVEEESKRVGLKKEDAFNRVRWRDGVRAIAVRMRLIRPTPFTGTKPDLKLWFTTTTTCLLDPVIVRSWGTFDDNLTILLQLNLFSTALCEVAKSRPVHSQMLSFTKTSYGHIFGAGKSHVYAPRRNGHPSLLKISHCYLNISWVIFIKIILFVCNKNKIFIFFLYFSLQ